MLRSPVYLSHFQISLNGNLLTDELKVVIRSVTVEDEINLPTMFVIKMGIIDSQKGNWRGIDMKTFKPGDAIKIWMGMEGPPVEMLTGELTSLDITFGKECFLELRGFDRLHRLRLGTHRRSFREMKDSDIAALIAREASLTSKVEDTGSLHPYVFQNDQSNLEFLLGRAGRIGYQLLAADKTLIFRKSREKEDPELSLTYNLDFDNFAVRLKTLVEGSEVEVRGWDMNHKKTISAKAGGGSEITLMGGRQSGHQVSQSGFGPTQTAVINEMVNDDKEAGNLAKARYNYLLKEFIAGEGSGIGNPQIRAGTTIALKGLGERFSGTYYIISTVHTLNIDQGYKTTFKVRRTGI